VGPELSILQLKKPMLNKISSWFSLVTTPTIIFLIPGISIYLNNQSEFSYSLNAISAILFAWICCYLAGALFFRLQSFRFFNLALAWYYSLGVCWFTYRIAHQQLNAWPGLDLSLFLILCLIGPILLSLFLKKLILRSSVISIISLAGFFLVSGNIGYLLINLETSSPSPPQTRRPVHLSQASTPQLPNIYHIVFDEYQTEMFELTLNPEIRRQMAGFTWFPENTSIYGRTEMSLSSYMQGKPFDFNESQKDYIDRAMMDTKGSLPFFLKKKGYKLSCYLHQSFQDLPNIYDTTIFHKDYVTRHVLENGNFFLDFFKGFISKFTRAKPVFIEETGTFKIPDVSVTLKDGSQSRWDVEMSLEKNPGKAMDGKDGETVYFSLDKISVPEKNNPASASAFLQATYGIAVSLLVYSELPPLFYGAVLPDSYLEQLKSQAFMPSKIPIVSYLSFENFLEKEQDKSPFGRYEYIHLILPHFPSVLKSDCSYNPDLSSTSPGEQSDCATKLILRFIDCLKSLDRYTNSIIIMHGDHGSRYKIKKGRLSAIKDKQSPEWSRARARALLLYKPPGMAVSESLVKSPHRTTLLDIAPTLVNAVDPEFAAKKIQFQGVPLLSQNFPVRKSRDFYFYKKISIEKGLTDKMKYYSIDANGDINFKKQITVNPGL